MKKALRRQSLNKAKLGFLILQYKYKYEKKMKNQKMNNKEEHKDKII